MELIHYAGHPVSLDRGRIYLQRDYHKPNGLWVSVRGPDDWVAWNEAEKYKPTTHAHRVVLRACAQVRRVVGVAEFDEFHRQYAFPSHWRRHGDDPSYWEVDWRRVAAEYDGVVIAPYLWERRMDPHWYYTWDCASGCIWNPNAIASLNPVE